MIGCARLALKNLDVRATVKRIYENGERCVSLLRKLQKIETYQTKAYPGTTGILDIDRSSGG